MVSYKAKYLELKLKVAELEAENQKLMYVAALAINDLYKVNNNEL